MNTDTISTVTYIEGKNAIAITYWGPYGGPPITLHLRREDAHLLANDIATILVETASTNINNTPTPKA